MTVNEYYEYVERLASEHKLIGHTAKEPHYFRGELEEFYTDLRNKVRFPALIAESFELTFDEDGKTRETSYIVAVAYKESKNWGNIYSAMSLCERIGDEVLRRITHDAAEGEICANVEAIQAVPLLDEQHLYAGMRYTIRLNTAMEWEPDDDEWIEFQ
jgi:hypothetical protein